MSFRSIRDCRMRKVVELVLTGVISAPKPRMSGSHLDLVDNNQKEIQVVVLGSDLAYKAYVNIPLLIGTPEQDYRTHSALRRQFLSLQWD